MGEMCIAGENMREFGEGENNLLLIELFVKCEKNIGLGNTLQCHK